jgi:hypothetical protein
MGVRIEAATIEFFRGMMKKCVLSWIHMRWVPMLVTYFDS